VGKIGVLRWILPLLNVTKGKGVNFLETLVPIYWTGRRYIREESNLATSVFLRVPETPYIQKYEKCSHHKVTWGIIFSVSYQVGVPILRRNVKFQDPPGKWLSLFNFRNFTQFLLAKAGSVVKTTIYLNKPRPFLFFFLPAHNSRLPSDLFRLSLTYADETTPLNSS
jgi:hypothetical protein